MKRFTLPVAYTQYDVKLTQRPPKVGKEPVQGYCNYGKREIAVHDHGVREIVRATLWHEWAHATLRELGRGDLCHNETLVEGLAIAIMRVRLETPWL